MVREKQGGKTGVKSPPKPLRRLYRVWEGMGGRFRGNACVWDSAGNRVRARVWNRVWACVCVRIRERVWDRVWGRIK